MRISGITFAVRKTHRTRNVILTIVVILLLAILAVVVVSAYQGWNILHPPKKDTDAFSSNIVPEYRDISFKGTDKDLLLNGWFFQSGSSDKTVIMAHSYGGNRLEFGMQTLDIIKDFLTKGYNVFTFDFRYSGRSGGKFSSFGYAEKDDLLAAIDYVRQQGSKHVVLMGFSTGASACILAAEENKTVEAVIADSAYSDLDEFFRNNLNHLTKLPSFPFNSTVLISMEVISGIEIKEASPIRSINDLAPCRILLIHGKGDPLIPEENSRDLYSAYSQNNAGKAQLWETDADGIADSYLKDPAGYMGKVFEFLEAGE